MFRAYAYAGSRFHHVTSSPDTRAFALSRMGHPKQPSAPPASSLNSLKSNDLRAGRWLKSNPLRFSQPPAVNLSPLWKFVTLCRCRASFRRRRRPSIEFEYSSSNRFPRSPLAELRDALLRSDLPEGAPSGSLVPCFLLTYGSHARVSSCR